MTVHDRAALALQLTQAISAAHGAIERAGDRALRPFGLSYRGYVALAAVDEGDAGGVRPSEVARRLGVSRAAATTFIQRLESKGLVETTPDEQDDRSIRVNLTKHGLEVLIRAGQTQRRLAARTIEGLPASALLRAIDLLGSFEERLAGRHLSVIS
jgi:DNA-binding MarR family transcriptional regulator